MQAREVLHKLLIQMCGEMHAVRREALETMVWAGLTLQRMTVTGLGRAIEGAAREKHNIKRADRLLSNAHLQSEREAMYGVLAQRLVGQQKQPVLLVDWSDLDEWRRNQVLRVSLAVEGKGAYRVRGSARSQDGGKAEDPRAVSASVTGCTAGRMSADLGDGRRLQDTLVSGRGGVGMVLVSRVRDRRYVRLGSESDWISANSLHPQASATPKAMGEVELAQPSPSLPTGDLQRQAQGAP